MVSLSDMCEGDECSYSRVGVGGIKMTKSHELIIIILITIEYNRFIVEAK